MRGNDECDDMTKKVRGTRDGAGSMLLLYTLTWVSGS
jgi:hypothetical protein